MAITTLIDNVYQVAVWDRHTMAFISRGKQVSSKTRIAQLLSEPQDPVSLDQIRSNMAICTLQIIENGGRGNMH